MQTIQILPPSVADQIAAGEVVERPGAALKELLENSLDAQATHIEIFIEEGGLKRIEVQDNGIGISAEDLPLSFARYATSKIHSAQDLHSIQTYGFRGEALAALGAVSRLKIHSLEKNRDEAKEIFCESSVLSTIQTKARKQGTTVSIENLFFNTPARKKFLKSSASENNFCLQVIYRAAMANHNCAFVVHLDNQIHLQLSARSNTVDRIIDLYRIAFHTNIKKDEVFSVEKKTDHIHLHAYILGMNHCLNNARGIFTFVNSRPVKDKLIHQAILSGAKEVLFGHEYPQAVLFLAVDPEYVDVNVHPTKSEVRFREPNPFGLIRSSIRSALLQIKAPITESTNEAYFPSPILSSVAAPETLESQLPIELNFEGNHTQYSILPAVASTQLPHYLGQIKNTYLVCEKENGLLLIDQHAAHERITYEKLKEIRLTKTLETSSLLIPIIIEIPNNLLLLFEPLFPELKDKLGLACERFGPNQIRILELPNLLIHKNGSPRVPLAQWIRTLAEALAEDVPKEEIFEICKQSLLETLASESCHHSVRAGQRLSPLEVEALLNEMQLADFAGHCPHGRPTCIELSWGDIEKLFKRRV